LKILTISNCPLNRSQGSGYVILNHDDYARKIGYEVDLYGPENYQLFRKARWGNAYRITAGIFVLLLKLRIKQYDIIEFWGGESWLAVWYLKMFYPKKVVIHKSNGIEEHVAASLKKYQWESQSDKKWYHFDMSKLYKKSEIKSDLIVTVSNYDKQFILNLNYKSSDKILSVYPGMTEAFKNLDINNERGNVIGFCGSWIERKGKGIIVQDVNKLLNSYPDIKVIFIGVGDHIDKTLVFPGVDHQRIIIYPSISDKKELTQVYKKISIAFMPSYHESFGLVLAEAMACGCAAVTSNTGYAFDLIHKQDAYIMPEIESEYLYEGISWFLDNPEDRARVSRNGYEKVQNLRWEKSLPELYEVYESIRQKK